MKVSLKKVTILFLCAVACLGAKELRWNWSKINVEDISFPDGFLWGASDSALQTEGLEACGGQEIPNCWSEFEVTHLHALEDQRVGVACERWTRYKDDIQLMKDCSMNAYRFSIAWEKIEPEEGVFDQEALDHYIEMIDELIAQGITPMVSFFHHTYPVWFAKKGGFAHEYNNKYFVRYARFVYKQLHEKVPFWLTLNEPIAYAFEGYSRGNYPPGEKKFRLAGKVALNLLNLHVEVYRSLKKIDQIPQIGLAHVMNLLDAHHPWNPIERIVVRLFDYIVNYLTIDFFKDGKFNWMWLVRGKNEKAIGAIDFMGINYYTHTTIRQSGIFTIGPSFRDDEKRLTKSIDDGRGCKVLYAEGLYRCIDRASALKIPMYITENGSSTDDPDLTDEYIKKHLYALSKAIKDGYDVRGYLIWTLMDCFGWKKGYTPKQGIYEVNFQTQERIFRPVFEYLVDVYRRFGTPSA